MALPCEDSMPLHIANKTITNLREDIRRLSDELRRKDELLSNFMDVVTKQCVKLSSLSAALQETAVWDSQSCPQPSCSTPKHEAPWTEVVIRGKKRDGGELAHCPSPSPILKPVLGTSNW